MGCKQVDIVDRKSCEIHAWAPAGAWAQFSLCKLHRIDRTRRTDTREEWDKNRVQELVHVYMYTCVFVCLQEELPALFYVGVEDFEGGELVPGRHGVTVTARRKRRTKLYTTSTFHTCNVCECVYCGFVSCLCETCFTLWATQAAETRDEYHFCLCVCVSVCSGVMMRMCECVCERWRRTEVYAKPTQMQWNPQNANWHN